MFRRWLTRLTTGYSTHTLTVTEKEVSERMGFLFGTRPMGRHNQWQDDGLLWMGCQE